MCKFHLLLSLLLCFVVAILNFYVQHYVFGIFMSLLFVTSFVAWIKQVKAQHE